MTRGEHGSVTQRQVSQHETVAAVGYLLAIGLTLAIRADR